MWSENDKNKKSEAAKKSNKVILANTNVNKRKVLSVLAKKQAEDGRINWSVLHTPVVTDKIKLTIKKKHIKWLESLNYKNKVEYRKACKFRFALKNFPEEFDFSLIEKYGWYRAKNKGNNPNGISRDHMYSIHEGFKNNVNPYYISHPANCKLMRHNENNKKDVKCSILLIDLIKRVNEWDNKYGADTKGRLTSLQGDYLGSIPTDSTKN
jgi:hypothetical protein